MRVKPPSLKGTGFVFALAAIGLAFAISNLLYILRPIDTALESPAVVATLLAFLVPGLVAANCAVVLLAFPHPRRRTLIVLLTICLAVCVGILLKGWGLLVIVLAAPTALLAMYLRNAHA